jgi:WD40 repeat protein
MRLAVLLLSCAQDAGHWSALAHEYELAGRPDHAVVALARQLVEEDSESTRRELARLTERRAGLLWTQRLEITGGKRTPSISAAAGLIAVGGDDVRVWREETGALVAHPIPVEALRVVLDPTGARVAVLEPSGRESIWGVAKGRRELDLAVDGGWERLEWSNDGSRVARVVPVGDGAQVGVWDTSTGQRRFQSRLVAERVNDLALSADGRFLAVVHRDPVADPDYDDSDALDVFDIVTGELVASGLAGEHSRVRFDPRTPRLMVHGAENGIGVMRAFDIEARAWVGPRLASLNYVESDGALVSDPSGRRWIIGDHVRGFASDTVTGAPAGAPLESDDQEDGARFKYSQYASTLSPDGRLAAVSGYGDTVRVWDTVSGKRFSGLLHHGAPVSLMEITAAGRLVTASADGVVRLWSLDGLTAIDTAVESDACAVHLAPGAARALVVHERGVVERLAADGETVWSFDAPARLGDVAISRDGSIMAACGIRYGLWTWNAIEPESSLVCVSRTTLFEVALDGTGAKIAAFSRDSAYLWSTATRELTGQWSLETGDGGDIAFDAAGVLWGRGSWQMSPLGDDPEKWYPGEKNDLGWPLALGEWADACLFGGTQVDMPVKWRAGQDRSSGLEELLADGAESAVEGWLVTAERVVALNDERATLIDPKARRVVADIEAGDSIRQGRLLGDRLVLVLNDWQVRMFDATTGSLLSSLAPNGIVYGVCPLPGTSDMVVSRTRYEVRVVDALSSAPVGEPLQLEDEPSFVRVIDASHALVGSEDGAVHHIALTDGSVREIVTPAGVEVLHVALSPDGQRVVTIEGPDVVVLRDTASGKVLYRRKLAPQLVEHMAWLGGSDRAPTDSAIEFDPTGRWLLVAGYITYSIGNGYSNHAPTPAEIVDAHDGTVVCALEDCDGMVEYAQFSADGERLVAWKWNRVQTWETRTGKLLATIELEHGVVDVRIQPGAELLSVEGDKGGFGVWELETGKVRAPMRVLESDRTGSAVLSPDGTLCYAEDGYGTGQWIDMTTGEVLCSAEHESDIAFGPDGRVLLERSRLGRPTRDGFVVEAIRPRESTSADWYLFEGRSRVGFIDGTRVVVGARPALDGVKIDVSDFGPSKLEPIRGAGPALMAEWCTKLGLGVTEVGEVK